MNNFASADSATKQSQGNSITAEDIQKADLTVTDDVATYAAMLGDDALMLGQRLGWWISRAPEMEEDIALANIALDLIGHTRFLYSYAGLAWGKTEDDLAYFRDEEEFRSARLMEQENGDFAQTIARQLIASHYMHCLYISLLNSSDEILSSIAAKAVKEVEYHVDHANQWVLRLSLGTDESKRRIEEGLFYMWPYTAELFEDLDIHRNLSAKGIAILPSTLRDDFEDRIDHVLATAELTKPQTPQAMSGHRTGRFSEQRGFILAELQVLARRHPGATW